jgi:hypothetical protein
MDGGQGGCDGVCVDSYAGADEVPDGGAHDCTNGFPDWSPDAIAYIAPNSISYSVPNSFADGVADCTANGLPNDVADPVSHLVTDCVSDRAAHGCADCGVHPGQVHHGALVQRPRLRGLWCWRVQRDLQRGKLHCMRERTFRLR